MVISPKSVRKANFNLSSTRRTKVLANQAIKKVIETTSPKQKSFKPLLTNSFIKSETRRP
jgi:hypothetical protein